VANAEEEGVVFEWLTLPKGFLGRENVGGVRIARMRLGMPDASGRKAPEEVKGADFSLKADLVIKALGFDPEDLPTIFKTPDLAVSKWGTIRVKPSTMMSSLDGVFAAGDIVRGASLVVWAIRDGRDAAASIHTYLQAKAQIALAAE
jgi:glutamate synthase (NADPH/NADH) small chain